jgi:hypothetical protein
MSLTNATSVSANDDTVFEAADGTGAKVVMDEPSLELLKGSKIDYTMELIGSQFKVVGIQLRRVVVAVGRVLISRVSGSVYLGLETASSYRLNLTQGLKLQCFLLVREFRATVNICLTLLYFWYVCAGNKSCLTSRTSPINLLGGNNLMLSRSLSMKSKDSSLGRICILILFVIEPSIVRINLDSIKNGPCLLFGSIDTCMWTSRSRKDK